MEAKSVEQHNCSPLRHGRNLIEIKDLGRAFGSGFQSGSPSERKLAPAYGFQAMVERAAKAAGFDMKIHPHMLSAASTKTV
jgi:hypothetical protein